MHICCVDKLQTLVQLGVVTLPEEITSDAESVRLLGAIARRIEAMQVPRYQALRHLVVSLLQFYLGPMTTPATSSTPPGCVEASRCKEGTGCTETTGCVASSGSAAVPASGAAVAPESILPTLSAVAPGSATQVPGYIAAETSGDVAATSLRRQRQMLLDAYIAGIPQNQVEKSRLVQHGYSVSFFTNPFDVTVTVTSEVDAEAVLKTALLPVLRQYVPLLRRLNVYHVNGIVVSSEFFDGTASLDQLRSRRAVCIRALQDTDERWDTAWYACSAFFLHSHCFLCMHVCGLCHMHADNTSRTIYMVVVNMSAFTSAD